MAKPGAKFLTNISIVIILGALLTIALGAYNSYLTGRLSSGVTTGAMFVCLGFIFYVLGKQAAKER